MDEVSTIDVSEPRPPFGSVLVVEDNTGVRQTIARGLEDGGCDVLQAVDGRQALATLLGPREVGLIVSGLEMPNMSGSELATILSSYIRLARIPIILLSERASIPATARIGAVVAFLRNPVEPNKLLGLVRLHLKTRQDAHSR